MDSPVRLLPFSLGRCEWMSVGIFSGKEGMLIFAGLGGTETENGDEKYH